MANKAVFLDRDNTLIEDPGYLSDPDAVKLIPGVELALKSLAQGGYRLVVVTNQSGIARGLLTEDQLEKIHAELRRQLAEGGAHLDAIFYCPFHPEGTVVEFAKESELRKPRPGMLLKAAAQMDIDLSKSWMIGDSPRDIEAGQRAGCRTIRVRMPGEGYHAGAEETDEDTQADLTVRNLVEAAKAILRHDAETVTPAQHPHAPATPPPGSEPALPHAPVPPLPEAPGVQPTDAVDDTREIQLEILTCLRQMVEPKEPEPEEFSVAQLLASLAQMLAILGVIVVVHQLVRDALTPATGIWALLTLVVQVMALTFTSMRRNR